MVNNELVKEKIDGSGYKYNFIADKLGITRQTLYRKLNGGTEWTVNEVCGIAELLQISAEEIYQIFFAQEVKN